MSRAPELDHVDRGIIEALQSNGRESFRRIAVSVGVSEATVRARYARLCEEGKIAATDLDLFALARDDFLTALGRHQPSSDAAYASVARQMATYRPAGFGP